MKISIAEVKERFLKAVVQYKGLKSQSDALEICNSKHGLSNYETREIFHQLTVQSVAPVAQGIFPTFRKKTKTKTQIAQPKPSITDFWENVKTSFEKLFLS